MWERGKTKCRTAVPPDEASLGTEAGMGVWEMNRENHGDSTGVLWKHPKMPSRERSPAMPDAEQTRKKRHQELLIV